MCLRPSCDRGQQQLESVVGLDSSKIGAVLAQVAKQRPVIRRDTLSDNCNSEPARGKRLDWHR